MKLHPSLLLVTLGFVSCAGGPVADSTVTSVASGSEAKAAADQTSMLVASLRGAGLTLVDAGMVSQPFFAVPAHVYQVDGRDLQVYEFADDAQATAAASQIAPAGSPIGTSMVTWMAAPHFFRKDRLIVNYIGTSDTTLAELRKRLGEQIAGR